MTTVAFVGLGVMGGPMSEHLARAGFTVRTFDRNGRGNCTSLQEALRGAEILVTMLPDGRAVRAVVEKVLRKDLLVIDTSSSDPAGTRALSSKVKIVDAPVSGAVVGARDASLTFMVGGSAADFERALPLLRAMGKNIFHVGPVGAGHAVKCLNNYLGAVGTLAGFEALLIARAFGLDPKPMLDAINASTGRNSTTERKIARDILTGAYASGFKLALMAKDVGIAAELSKKLKLETPFLKTTLRMWRQAQRTASADADHSEIFKYQEKLSKRRSSARLGRRLRRGRKPAPSRAARAPRGSSRRSRRRST